MTDFDRRFGPLESEILYSVGPLSEQVIFSLVRSPKGPLVRVAVRMSDGPVSQALWGTISVVEFRAAAQGMLNALNGDTFKRLSEL